jgi:uncharacterized membrane protein
VVVRIERSVGIARPPEVVFDAVTDLARVPQWQASAAAVEVEGGGPVEEGAVIRERRRALGHDVEQRLEVTAYERGRLFVVEVLEGPLHATIRHTFAPEGEGTLATVVVEARPGGLARLAAGLLVRRADHELAADLERLRALLETGAPPPR